MDRIIKSKMQQKRGTSAEIASSTEVLLEGEIVYDTTNKKIKVGDGKTQIKNLPYLKGDGDFLPLTGNRTITGPVRINYEPGSEAEALDVQGIAAFNNSRFFARSYRIS